MLQSILRLDKEVHKTRTMAEASASSALSGPPIGPSCIKFEWTLPLPESPFYKEENCWSSNSQVQSCTLCNEELNRTPMFDSLGNIDPTGKSDLDLLAKKYIHYHFTSVRHEDNLKKAMEVATGKSNATSTTKQPNTKTQMPVHFTGTGHGTTQRRSRSRRKASSPQRTCVICKASSLHMVGTKADGQFILSAAHLDQLHHKKSVTRFLELSEEEHGPSSGRSHLLPPPLRSLSLKSPQNTTFPPTLDG